ncbi:MAG TPA: hypothetical protein VGE21_00815 [Flavobacteriales bacterium]
MRIRTSFHTAALALGVLAFPNLSSAQFEEGDNVLGLGVGLLGGYGIGFSGSGVSQSPAIAAHFDHGMGDLGPGTWGLGGYVGYKSVGYEAAYPPFYTYDYKYTFLVVGLRGSWHYNEWHGNDKLDTYGGIMLGYRSVNFKDNTDYGQYGYLNTYSYSGSGLGFSGYLGARYYFSDKIGAFGELGYGIATLQLGVAVKL